jgi:hypothetical protein
MCSAPKQGLTLPASVDLEKETVITGRVVDGSGQSVGGAFVRLLDSSDEFTAEVVASATGDFRFFAAPGAWTLRALSPAGNGDASVAPSGAGIHEVDVKVARVHLASGAPASRGAADALEPPVASLLPAGSRLDAVVLFFEIMLVAAVVVITWFALYALYRLVTDD